MSRANELLGILHAAYGLGATFSPLIATTMVTKANLPWYKFYYVCLVAPFSFLFETSFGANLKI